MQVNKALGMVSLNDALMELVTKKVVEPAEAYTKAVDKSGFDSLLKRVGISLNAPDSAARPPRPTGAPA
jgi:twitching motility protein PilT